MRTRKHTWPWLGALLLFACTAHAQIEVREPISLPKGFEIERIHNVDAKSQGSWVCLTPNSSGLIAADQYGALYEFNLSDRSVKKLNIGVGNAQGLLVAHGALYVMSNGGEQSGLYRSLDKDNDGRWDQAELLIPIEGEGEHGPHAIVLTPDQNALFICAGNHAKLPKLTGSRVPMVWAEDLALERIWDPRGHAVGIEAPGGWVCRVSLDGSTCELYSVGYRNHYDLAMNPDGELFTFDADMEWDAGTAWYRPTRILHVTSGSEFGWRGGTGKWPEYFPDNLPSVIALGPGSPTGITFGTGTKFPAKYQRALFAADWSYGRIHAVHLKERGSTYVAEAEVFATATALPVTDMIVHPEDGCLYFATGGRRLQSALYRVRYMGDEPTTDIFAGDAERVATAEVQLRKLRQDIEMLHDTSSFETDVDVATEALKQLSHPDRHIRYAARTALELNPLEQWLGTELDERDIDGRIALAIAIARCAPPENAAGRVLANLEPIEFSRLSNSQKLALLRAYMLGSIRTKDQRIREAIVRRFNDQLPSDDRLVNRELARALVQAHAGDLPERLMALVEASDSVADRTHYLFALSNLEQQWDATSYFSQLAQARQNGGGKSFGGYIDAMADRALERLGNEYQNLADQVRSANAETQSSSAPLVREWTADEIYALVERPNVLDGRDVDKGKSAFAKASCFACHQVNSQGNAHGPDLTAIGSRFGVRDMATTIVEPSLEISDQYARTVYEMEDGRTVIGRVVNLVDDTWFVATDMMNPGHLEEIAKPEIESTERSDTSPMPTGLLNVLTEEEVLDLFAYLSSLRGN